jgi:hypothetical protein
VEQWEDKQYMETILLPKINQYRIQREMKRGNSKMAARGRKQKATLL